MSGFEIINKIKRVALPAAAIGATAALAAGCGGKSNNSILNARPSKAPEAISITPHHLYETYKGCAPIGNLAITGAVVHEGKSITFYGDTRQEPQKGEYASILQHTYDSFCHIVTDNGQLYAQATEPAEQFATVVEY